MPYPDMIDMRFSKYCQLKRRDKTRTAVAVHQLAHHRQTDATAMNFGREKRRKNMRDQVIRHAGAIDAASLATI